MRGWLQDHHGAIAADEAAFAGPQYNDLMDVVEQPRSPLRSFLEALGIFSHQNFSFFQREDSGLPDMMKEGTVHYAEERIDSFVNGVLCVVGFGMITTPLWVLFALGDHKKLQLVVITMFVGLFLLVVQGVSAKVRPFESLAATAA